jgi:type I restriction enzyme M protein
MVDARNVYRKVTRKIYDFSPEQMQNLAAIIWLYRGQREQFVSLVKAYFNRVCEEIKAIPATLTTFEATLADLRVHFVRLADWAANHKELEAEKKKQLVDAINELHETESLYDVDRGKLLSNLQDFGQKYSSALLGENEAQRAARKAYDPIAEAIRGLVKQVDLLYKLTGRVADLGAALTADGMMLSAYDRRDTAKLVKMIDEQRKAVVEQLRHAIYFYRQVTWLQDRFPEARLTAVPGLVKLVGVNEIEAADWSLSPGRYVGVTPLEEDEGFDFEQSLHDIHIELADLNKEAAALAEKIHASFEELIG